MRLATKGGINWRERESFRWFRLRKRIYQWFRYRPHQPKTVLFIVGCQRSGTSMLSHLFRLDWDVVTYDEMSPLSSVDPEGFRWNPLPEVKARLLADRAPLVVCKPLVESQNLTCLLDEFPGSKAIWMYRDYRDVASSNVKFFGPDNGHRDLAPLLKGERENWRAENVPIAEVEAVRALMTGQPSGLDAAALFWYVRNRLFFAQNLTEDPRVVACDYATLVADPLRVLAEAYRFLGRPFPGARLVGDVSEESVGRGGHIALSPAIEDACRQVIAELRRGRNLGSAN